MKTTFAAVSVCVIAALFPGLLVSSATAGDPVPGIDVIFNQIPGGEIVKGRTDREGRYQFTKLKPGTYLVHVAGQPDRKITVGADGKASGTVRRSATAK